jgi:hypothetical protein
MLMSSMTFFATLSMLWVCAVMRTLPDAEMGVMTS